MTTKHIAFGIILIIGIGLSIFLLLGLLPEDMGRLQEGATKGGDFLPDEKEGWLPHSFGESEIIPADLTQITFFEGEGVTADPDWSPDGTQIVFGRHDENKRELYIVNSDGTGLTKIGPDDVFDPSWSPVDNRILCYGGEIVNYM